MWDTIAQIGLTIFGVTAIILVAKKNKWGFVFGLLSQPFWFITSFVNKQWGVFFVSIIYTFSWLFGIYEWFFKSKRTKLKNARKKHLLTNT
jgi:nicotinamide riboside transporter PnuC